MIYILVNKIKNNIQRMGICESKRNMAQIIIEKNIRKNNNNLNNNGNEAFIPGNAASIQDEKLKIIVNQKEKSICKIIKNNNPIGTGFLCSINKDSKKRTTLITANHVLGVEDLKIGKEIKITFGDKNEDIKILKINNSRNIYSSEIDDITIIEILKSDNLQNYNPLEIDKDIYNNSNIDFNDKYKNKSIYILNYPKCIISSFSDNIIIKINKDNTIYHFCSTEHGSSGAPILNLETLKVIGIHQAHKNVEKDIFRDVIIKVPPANEDNTILCNIGKIIQKPIFNFNKENKIVLTLKINKEDINKNIYFLGNYDDYLEEDLNIIEKNKLNINNCVIFINGNNYQSRRYFKPKFEGIYYITIKINHMAIDYFRLFYDCRNILKIDLSSFNTKNVTNMSYMFYGCSNLTNIDLSSFDTKNVINMSNMFSGCSNLTNIDLSSFDTKNVTNMSSMFKDCSNLENINPYTFDTKNIYDMSYMFAFCSKLTYINLIKFDTKKVTNMSYMFKDCYNLENINLSNFDTKNVTNMNSMFSGCSNLKNINLSSFKTEKVTNMSYMFIMCSNLTNIDLSFFDTKNVTDISHMFAFCSSLKDINLSSFNTENVTDMRCMFEHCSNLKNINISSFDTKNVTNMRLMFAFCSNLTNINISSFDIKNVTDISDIFGDCYKLEKKPSLK